MYIGRDPVTGRKRELSRTYRAPRSVKGSGRRAAELMLRDLLVEADGARGSSATLGALLEDWLAHSERLGRSPTTLASYRRRVKTITAALGDVQLNQLTTRHLDRWYAQLLDGGRSPADVLAFHRVLSAALRQGERWGMVTHSPAHNAARPRVPRHEIDPPTPAQVENLIRLGEHSRNPEMGGIIMWAALTGMRRGEICGLQWTDVDLATGRVTVRRSVYQTESSVGVKAPKTHQARRLAVDRVALEVLRRRRARAEEDARAAAVQLTLDGYVWSSDLEGVVPMRPDRVTQAFTRLCRKAEQETGDRYPFRLHDLRHYSATELLAAGVDLATVSKRLGHDRLSTTSDIYTHGREASDEIAAGILGGQLSGALNP